MKPAMLMLLALFTCLSMTAVAPLLPYGPFRAPTAWAQEKPAIAPADYGVWEEFAGQPRLSPDGRWLGYAISLVNEEDELRVQNIERGATTVIPFGADPVFSPDSHWLAYSIGVSPDERERLEEEEEPVRTAVGILDLGTADTISIPAIASFRFSGDGRFLALFGYPAEADSTDAADLLVRELTSGRTTHFGNVTAFEWSDRGALLALSIRSASGAGNALQLYDAASGTLRVLDSSPSLYRGLAWREDAADLAVLRTVADSMYRDTTHVVLAWRGLGRESPGRLELDPTRAAGLPSALRIAEHHSPEWAANGSALYIGLRPRERADSSAAIKASTPVPDSAGVGADTTGAGPAGPDADTTGTDADTAGTDADQKISDVQVWHAQDERIFPMQRAQAERDLHRTFLAVWHLERETEGEVVVIGTDLTDEARMLEGGRFATETDHDPYRREGMFGRPWDDVYLVDARTGERRPIVERVRYFLGGSATGRYLLWFDGEDYWTYDIRTATKTNLTANLEAVFEDLDHDYPVEVLPPHGVAGWLADDRTVLIYDEYDIWRISPDGSGGTRLTRGAADRVVHRYVPLDPDEEGIDPSRPLYLRIHGEWSERSGFARLEPDGAVSQLVFEDARLTGLARADSADVFLFRREDFDDSPDVFVGGAGLRDARQVTHTNPFQAEFAWGRSELIEYRSQTGRRLQGALYYPANHDASRRYPMIVYQYEILSPRVHGYMVPSERSYYNATVWTSQGYFVLMPDIVYRPRDPGRSAVEAVVPAVEAVVGRGLVDPERVGLIGHSWGGYQATYIPTQTDVFAASVAGAPLTNFLSMPGAIHWRPGLPELGHWETGQARMGVPPWEDFEAHVRNSPAAFIAELATPMLMMFGDEDGTVDWHQGIQFYNFARRAGKDNFVLLVYPGEDHGLTEKVNQIDYHRRILQWFGHWLKGEPAPEWMTDGVSYLERERRLEGSN